MKHKQNKPFSLLFLSIVSILFVGTGTAGSGSIPEASTSVKDPLVEEAVTVEKETEELPSTVEEEKDPAPALSQEEVSNPWDSYPNVCETFTVIQSPKQVKDRKGKRTYPIRYRRNRYQRTRKDRARTRDLVEMVAKEMGVEHPEFFSAFAMHESTWNPEAIHILNPDLDANQKAWKRHSYSLAEEQRLEEALANSDARTKEYWKLKSELADIRLYKGNQYWNDRLQYDYVVPEHVIAQNGEELTVPSQVTQQSRNVWGFGYGLYGMYAVGYVKVWDQEAPPWILCSHEGIVATIIQVWAARNDMVECDLLTEKDPEKYGHDGGTYRGTLRRLARGRCSDAKLGPKWRSLFKQHSDIPWDKHADFGTKWPQYEMKKRRGKWVYKRDKNGDKIPTSREALLAHMLKKAEEKGLLRSEPLKRHDESAAPVIVTSDTSNRSSGASVPKNSAP